MVQPHSPHCSLLSTVALSQAAKASTVNLSITSSQSSANGTRQVPTVCYPPTSPAVLLIDTLSTCLEPVYAPVSLSILVAQSPRYHRCTRRPACMVGESDPAPARPFKIPSIHHPSCSVSRSCSRQSPVLLVSPQCGQASWCLRTAKNSLVCTFSPKAYPQSPRVACHAQTFLDLQNLLSSLPEGAPR